jgi:microcystin-dependent protein
MSDPFLGEIKIVGFNFAPRNWASCDGQILPINQNQSLYALLGTMYGGDGRTSFALPDLRGRTPIHVGSRPQGNRDGAETHTITGDELPAHTHPVMASSTPGSSDHPEGALLAGAESNLYQSGGPSIPMSSQGVSPSGGTTQPHDNMQPFLVLNFVIALVGTFPSRP